MTVAVVMGVSGSGKTTVADGVARRNGWRLVEGDKLHPPANVAKMKSGTPLTDADRWPWLRAIAREIDAIRARGESAVVASSALKRAYRDILIGDRPDVVLVYLEGLEGSDRRAHGGTQEPFHAAGAAGQPVRHAGRAWQTTNIRSWSRSSRRRMRSSMRWCGN